MSQLKQAFPGEPIREDIIHTRGDTYLDQIRGWNKDGTPYDFTNHTFLMQIKVAKTDDESVIEIADASVTIEADSIGTNAGVKNLLTIQHGKASFEIEPKDYVYDIQITDGAGVTKTIYEGCFTIEQDTSRPIA